MTESNEDPEFINLTAFIISFISMPNNTIKEDIFTNIKSILKNNLQLKTLILKTGTLYFFIIVFRWTLPRLKADQLITLSWKYLTPIAIFCLVGSTCWMVFFNGKSLWEVCLFF